MKKLARILAALMLLILAISCSSTVSTRDLLIPDGRALERKLPYLENLNQGKLGINDIEKHSPLYTIWERELRSNILDMSTEKKGSIEIVEIYRSSSKNFMKTKEYLDLEFEIRIYSIDGRVIWTRSYCNSDLFSLPFFPPKTNPGGLSNAENMILKKVIEEFKDDIEVDYDMILEKLQTNS